MRRCLTIYLSLAAVVMSAGCDPVLYSPRANTLLSQSAVPVGKGRVAVAAGGSLDSSVEYDRGAKAGALEVRYGVSEDAELSVHTFAEEQGLSGINLESAGGRLGGKVLVSRTEHLAVAFAGGLGGGFFDEEGHFITADAGLLFSLPNRYLIPTFSALGFTSAASGAETFEVSGSCGSWDGCDGPSTERVDVESITGAALGLSLRVPIVRTSEGFHHLALVGGAEVALFPDDSIVRLHSAVEFGF